MPLSYYWGDPTPTRKIYVNESLVDLHEALWEFLNQMQRSQQTGNWIWTDFLCLNQKNHEEMGQQVPRMGHIYSEAARTISWLGCSSSSWISSPDRLSTASTDVEEDLRRIREKVSVKRVPVQSFFAQEELPSWTSVTKVLYEFRGYKLDAYLPSEPFTLERQRLPKPIKEVVQLSQGHMTAPILSILSLPYWTRVWIAQEVALAKNVTLVFGGVSLGFQDFFLAYKSYFYFLLKHCQLPTTERPVPIEARAAVDEGQVSFYQIVRWGLDCNASKPLDRIYGLLGLLSRCGDGSQTLPLTLNGIADYRRDLSGLFWDMAFTRPFSTESFTTEDKFELKEVEYWVNVLPALGKVLSCPFTPEGLRNEANNPLTPLARDKAHLALYVVEICRQAWIGDRTIRIKSTLDNGSWLTKRHASRLWLDRNENLQKQILDFKRFLGSLVLETSKLHDMDEDEEYQAVCIGLRMSKLEGLGSMWNCGSQQISSDKHHRCFYCVFPTTSSQLPC